MANFCIMRVEKRKRADVVGIQREANRTSADEEKGWFEGSDIDWSRTDNNLHFKKTDAWNKEITERLREENIKPRKDAVVLLDGLYAVSGDWLDDHTEAEAEEYFRDCLDFHVKEYCGGDESLLLNAVVHRDESEWHMQVASIPLLYDREKQKNRLSAKDIMGNRSEYSNRQDRFWLSVGKPRGLERGDKTKEQDASEYRRHMTKREYEKERLEAEIEEARLRLTQLEEAIRERGDLVGEYEKKAKKLLTMLHEVKNAGDYKQFRLAINELCKEMHYRINIPDPTVMTKGVVKYQR